MFACSDFLDSSKVGAGSWGIQDPGSTTGYGLRLVPSLMVHKAGREVLILSHSGGTEGSKVSIPRMCRAEAELSRHVQALGGSLLPGIWGKQYKAWSPHKHYARGWRTDA